MVKPLPRNALLASFDFEIASEPIELRYWNSTTPEQEQYGPEHFTFFSKAIAPIIQQSNARELHLRFTQGWWDSDTWGALPKNGLKSGGTGVEVLAVIEAYDVKEAQRNWFRLSKALSGFFCASLNFIEPAITTYPQYKANDITSLHYIQKPGNKLYILRAALPSEPICTENLTPFLKLLPTRGKAGISSLLDGHKVFDSLWHSMAVDVTSVCDDTQDNNKCHLRMEQSVTAIVDVLRSLRKHKEGGIPRPVKGDELRCDPSKTHNPWQCFPLDDPVDLKWNLGTIFGRNIKGQAFSGNIRSSILGLKVDSNHWKTQLVKHKKSGSERHDIVGNSIAFYLDDDIEYDVSFETANGGINVAPIEKPPILLSRALTGYSQDHGGLRTEITNPSNSSMDFVYFETLPWFMRLYLSSMVVSFENETSSYTIAGIDGSTHIKDIYYKPAVDRKRPAQIELSISLPPKLTLLFSYEFDKSILLLDEYPPDANHGFAIDPAVITIIDDNKRGIYEVRSTSLVLSLPTPDFSMPYNVIIFTCTVMSLAFGSLYQLLVKKVVTEEEFEAASVDSGIKGLVSRVKSKLGKRKRDTVTEEPQKK
ncbi:Subunit of the glycosylphosphatidylinositol transamidase complex-like protein [Scheffersomyces spartinae]|uniref:Subunit of the glycosylphosphatidylinositol transamidase complex-like protein n=1 Tax=Scheffersomyces spartinae TaxID=45513 RepID=A0A9P7V860_9ASCO|nr:Subunit of the glycosylphosphatidylinositol transamidase complex-like protein [Scheffersomyces spartinae]KAG7193147.1 Subunit of the glycosylphosphatidylinositol transamidase complex-like protein [Scheffersomyces spartinae]